MTSHRIVDFRRHGPSAAELLRDARRRSGRSQADVAMHTRTSASALSRYEHGKMDPTYDTLRDLLQTCGYVLEPHLVPVGGAGWCDPYIRRRREMFGLPLVIVHPRGSPSSSG